MLELFAAVGIGLAMILPLANPLTTVALLMGLSRGMSETERNRQALKASIYSFAIMMVAFYVGQLVMNLFGVSITGLRIAGGLIVAFIGLRMLFPAQQLDATRAEEARGAELRQRSKQDTAVSPLAMPTTAGPGTIAMIISVAAALRSSDLYAGWVVLVAPPLTFFLACAILLLCLRSSGFIMRKLGNSGVEAFSRLIGFLLVCIGVQFVINGVYEVAVEVQALLAA